MSGSGHLDRAAGPVTPPAHRPEARFTVMHGPRPSPADPVVVVSALSLSVLPRTIADAPVDLSDDEVDAIVEEIVRERRHAPSSELTPLPRIAELARSGVSPEQRRLRLVLLADGANAGHRGAIRVIGTLLERLPLGATVEVETVDLETDGIGVDGSRRAMAAVPRAIAELAASGAEVWVNATAGVSSVAQPLVALAGVAGWTVFTVPDRSVAEVTVLSLPPLGPDRTELLHRLDLATFAPHAPSTAGVGTPSDAGALLNPASGELTDLGRYYRSLASSIPERRAHASCAALLTAHAAATGDREAHRLAVALRGCVEHWVIQRLWSLNLVPELVAHDDRHVERVDGLVASLAAPLLYEGVLEPRDVAVLSAGAWLHDWGHVGSRLGRDYVGHPVAVRYLHGLLSRELIADSPRSHRLAGLGDGVAAEVGVICAHHQGWCSCDATAPSQRTPEAAPVRLLGLLADDDEITTIAPSLHDAARRAGMTPERAEVLVALLRVADAADVGIHRVPDYGEHHREFLLNCGRRALARARGELAVARLDPHEDASARAWLDELTDDDRFLALADDHPLLDAPSDHITLVLAQDYLRVLRDPSHQDLHHRVLSVRLHTSEGCAQPLVSARAGHEDRALGDVATFIDRELARPCGDGTVGDRLADVGLRFAAPRLDR